MLQLNTPAPLFVLQGINQDNKEFTFNLAEHKGKNIVLYFYPKNDTPGCTTQSCNFANNMHEIANHNAIVVGVSLNNLASHVKFKQKYNLNFPLLFDNEAKVSTMYFSYGKKKFMGKEYMGIIRNTFLIDTNGVIKHIWQNVIVNNHLQEVLQELQNIS